MLCNANDVFYFNFICVQHLDLRITSDSPVAGSLGDYSTIRQLSLEDSTVGKSDYNADYLDRNYVSVFDGKTSNGDSLKNFSGIMGKNDY